MTGILKVDQIQNNTGTSVMTFDSAGNASAAGLITKPNLPYFLVQSPHVDVTYTDQVIPYSNVIEDQGNNYDTTNYCFTAPITGVYMFSFTCNGMTNGADRAYIQRANDGSNYYNIDSRGETYSSTSQGLHARGSESLSNYYYMGLQVPLKVNAGGKVRVRVNIGSVNTFHANFFTGYLIG